MAENNITMEDLRERLQKRQHKMTPQRQIVLQVFMDRPGEHLSAEDVHSILRAKHSEIGLATVYRSLELLEQLGILLRVEFGDGCSRYEIAGTHPGEHQHHHLICLQCGKVQEFSEDLLGNLENKITEDTGFAIKDHQVKFFGYCKECRAQRREHD